MLWVAGPREAIGSVSRQELVNRRSHIAFNKQNEAGEELRNPDGSDCHFLI